jgi:hypothetical protein
VSSTTRHSESAIRFVRERGHKASLLGTYAVSRQRHIHHLYYDVMRPGLLCPFLILNGQQTLLPLITATIIDSPFELCASDPAGLVCHLNDLFCFNACAGQRSWLLLAITELVAASMRIPANTKLSLALFLVISAIPITMARPLRQTLPVSASARFLATVCADETSSSVFSLRP